MVDDLNHTPRLLGCFLKQLRDVAYDIFTDPVSVYPGVPSEVI
ncbi:predicted protein [Botrytis cinerea T4]|uniref:Uncharacterized protein n=1 Tax=Botryotinia fuckeliana (strain T4) TaxID=999810 RepID=G2YYQ2_BOTF4|nr:predicted protein [Botrytis cinerea T4]